MKNKFHKIVKGAPLKGQYFVFLIAIVIGFCQNSRAQFLNNGEVIVKNGTLMAVYFDYINTTSGNFINNGEVHVFENWNNDGTVSYDSNENGKTFFTGTTQQIIEGKRPSDFQNIVFNNNAAAVPFHLAGTITIGKTADFTKGIVNAGDYNGLVVFNKNAFPVNAGDQSFIDGKTENNIDEPFEFPVGDGLYFRPAFYSADTAEETVYTSQYFYENAANLHPYTSKEETILVIDDAEYWIVTQNKGTEKIILSLTLSEKTTPNPFFKTSPETELAIVRWDETASKWVSDGGVLSDPITGEAYSNLLTGQVGGYGIFTMAIVKKANIPESDLVIYNAISPNGDGLNDTFQIKGIDQYPDNTVEIYNRWGVKVFEAASYNETDNLFRGYSDGRATIKKDDKLPTGTYFYTLKYNNKAGKTIKRAGYLYVNNQ